MQNDRFPLIPRLFQGGDYLYKLFIVVGEEICLSSFMAYSKSTTNDDDIIWFSSHCSNKTTLELEQKQKNNHALPCQVLE